MKEKTQSLIFFVVLGVAGYFAYQYVIAPWLAGKSSSEPAVGEYLLFVPEPCQSKGEALKDGLYRHEELGNLSESGLNGLQMQFQRCLKREGFTDSQVSDAVEMIKNSR